MEIRDPTQPIVLDETENRSFFWFQLEALNHSQRVWFFSNCGKTRDHGPISRAFTRADYAFGANYLAFFKFASVRVLDPYSMVSRLSQRLSMSAVTAPACHIRPLWAAG